jgi:hypothetical protein
MAAPNAKTGSDGAKTGMKITTVIHAMKNIIVRRQPNRSWQTALITSPANWPTRAEFARPDCHSAGMSFCFDASSYTPNRSLNWV